MAKNDLPEQIRARYFIPRFGEAGSFAAAGLFQWLIEPHTLQQDGRKIYLNRKLTGKHWQQILCALVVVLESRDFKETEVKRARFDELLELPLGHFGGRDAEIHAIFNGTNLAFVMEQFGVSKATVYRAAKKRKSQNPPR